MILTKPKSLSMIEQERIDADMPIVTLGQEIAKTKIELSQKDALFQSLGEELAILRLDIIQLKGGGQ
ncbi:hypothetical protein EEL32_05520 [Brevibacillus laterosporus]|uniref:Uncharacterized protein n=1 Tax=Brevibacillus laterosporus TaxID=1465 RepID=A0A502IWF9_BRELA|nr:hypothetical protein [Brevibacillus laterosporus]QDX93789.1 hypothetical protein EEL30_16715 [Brevibacillus laterosporus]RAP27626.1 hypothetical protein C2W64_00774 [Brevibacillus laterosporus]TPG73453.1 hypothetical protein EEL31_03580 [Brevibacillus laterosporus]TPG89570.1 hypothetical protein EEL32_05520 [Brevibacillus laterosporus]